MKYIRLFLIVGIFLLSIAVGFSAVPSWTVNSSSYSNSMTITAVIKLDNVESTDVNDKVGAFVNGECRGTASPIYMQSEDRYYIYLLIYSNEASGENVTFKVYDASKDIVIDATNKYSFSIDEIVGSNINPYVFMNITPSKDFQSLTFAGINSNTTIDQSAKTITVKVAEGTNLTNLVAVFQLSDGAIAKINSVTQESGVTENDFSSAKVYQVIAADGTTQNWTVNVVKVASSLGVSTSSLLNEKLKMFPIPATEYITLDLTELEWSNYSVSISSVLGDEIRVFSNINTPICKIDVSDLQRGIYVINLINKDQKGSKMFVKQ